MGREVTQLDLGVMVGLNLAFVEVRKWEEAAILRRIEWSVPAAGTGTRP
jgi:hypothetical protein